MKKLMMMAFVALALVACKNDKAKVDNSAELQRDSLNQIIAQRDAEINDMMATLNEIENGFKEINAAQNRVNTAKDTEGVNQKERIRENITYIQSTMQQNRQLILTIMSYGPRITWLRAGLSRQTVRYLIQTTQLRLMLSVQD